MRRAALLAMLVVIGGSAAACESSAHVVRPAGPRRFIAHVPPARQSLYGHIKSVVRRGGRVELRLDPAWWLTGLAAQRAAVEDKYIRPGEDVPNDYYVVEGGHRLLTFAVRQNARVTILDRVHLPKSIRTTVDELPRVLRHRTFGFWIGLDARGRVVSIDQQYQP